MWDTVVTWLDTAWQWSTDGFIPWTIGIIALIGTALRRWIREFITLVVERLPSPQRVLFAIENTFNPKRLRDHVTQQPRVVLSWLEEDPQGTATKQIARAVDGDRSIKVLRTARIVRARHGAVGEWSDGMRGHAEQILSKFGADVVVAGYTEGDESAWLYFVPIFGDGTLTRGDKP